MNCQLALVHIRAMDVMEKVLGLDRVSAVLGGHSKRGRSATVAAAMDSRVASPIIMGNESVYRTDQIQWHLSFHHAFFQDQVNVPVFYLGATNEGGYNMFNINILQERLKEPMTIEMIPNYRHYNFHEIQFIDTMMWVAHIFDGRPISRITETSHEYRDGRNYYRAKIESEAKVQVVRTWFVYADNPQWRDLMWFEWIMQKRGDYHETSVPGQKVDAYMIEVTDIAMGFPGYVTSLPIKVTNAPVLDRKAQEAGWMGPRKARQ
jgi:PhoPQ-activated pathogenicity-related protein